MPNKSSNGSCRSIPKTLALLRAGRIGAPEPAVGGRSETFFRAAKLDPQFGEAFLGLGASLVSEKQYADAIVPLETAVRLEPGIRMPITISRWLTLALDVSKMATKNLPFIGA